MSTDVQPNDADWGVFARSAMWFSQSVVLVGISMLVDQMKGTGDTGLVVSIVSAFLIVLLLFRHVNALIEQKMGAELQ